MYGLCHRHLVYLQLRILFSILDLFFIPIRPSSKLISGLNQTLRNQSWSPWNDTSKSGSTIDVTYKWPTRITLTRVNTSLGQIISISIWYTSTNFVIIQWPEERIFSCVIGTIGIWEDINTNSLKFLVVWLFFLTECIEYQTIIFYNHFLLELNLEMQWYPIQQPNMRYHEQLFKFSKNRKLGHRIMPIPGMTMYRFAEARYKKKTIF